MGNHSTAMQKLNTNHLLPHPVSRVGFGAFHIGRVAGDKYASAHRELPTVTTCEELLHGVLDLGITLIDTAPAYGLSEERIGHILSSRRNEYNLCTKVGELFENGSSVFDFSPSGMRASLEHSLRTLQTDYVDILLIHAPPNDLSVLLETDAIETMLAFKQEGKTRAIGFSGKTLEAEKEALPWSDVMMIEYSAANQDHKDTIELAHNAGKIVLIKKALNSGHLSNDEAVAFFANKTKKDDASECIVIGSMDLSRMHQNVKTFTYQG
jgi:aryl-alcohol dehydrogenase-like predicted oxidoreductase